MAHKEHGTRRRLYPMPVEPIYDHPLALTLPTAGYGMLMRLCHHFWVTECEPLPTAEFELRHIARAHAPTWRTWKEPVMRIFNDVRPALESYYLMRLTRTTHLTRLGEQGHGVKRLAAIRTAKRSSASVIEAAPRKQRGAVSSAPKAAPAAGWASD